MIKKIDTHIHLAGVEYSESQKPCLTINDVNKLYELLNIEKGVIIAGAFPHAINNEQAEVLCKEMPDKFCRFAYVSLINGLDAALMEVEKAYRTGAKGIGEFVDNCEISSPDMDELFAACEYYQLPFLFHMTGNAENSYGLIDQVGLPGLERALKKYPKLKIIGHSACFWSEISSDVTNREGYPFGAVQRGRLEELFDKYPNLYGDLSANSASNALLRDSIYGISFLKKYNKRLLFATDSSICPMGPWLDLLVAQGALSEMEYNNIVRNNAEREIIR